MSTRLAEQIADAVLYEGYVLYPYRASAAKNRLRWQVGLVMPREYAEAAASDPWFMRTECVAETNQRAALTVRVRCLQVQERVVEAAVLGDPIEWPRVDTLRVDDHHYVTWDEAVVCEFVREGVSLEHAPIDHSWRWALDSSYDVEILRDRLGMVVGRIVRRRKAIVVDVRMSIERCGRFTKIRIGIDNVAACEARTLAQRDAAVRQSLAGTHTMLAIDGGAFVSLLDPPPEAAAITASCSNAHTFPVLIGPSGARQVMLSSPIILPDYPAIAPESAGDLCDATEIDELLTLRVRTMTDDEKREARATDPRAARIIERCDAASAETLGTLHGAIRSFESFVNPADEPAPEDGSVDIHGVRVARGTRVRVQPARVSDSIDICVHGRTAMVTAVYRTLEGKPYIAVTLDDDPFGAEGAKYRRSLFFHADEIVPLERGIA